jgi:hypothetical protein
MATSAGLAVTSHNEIGNAKFNSRFKAMKQNRDYSYIFAKAETGEKVLVKVRKSDGVEVDKIIFKKY